MTTNEEWFSTSDTIINLVSIKPPLTTKYVKGQTQEGIFKIAQQFLDDDEESFLKRLQNILKKENEIWEFVLHRKLAEMRKKVLNAQVKKNKKAYNSKMEVFTLGYAEAVTNLENHTGFEFEKTFSEMNVKFLKQANEAIQRKLLEKRELYTEINTKKLENECKMVDHYYELLMKKEQIHNVKLINTAVFKRNEAFKILKNDVENENKVGTMFVLSLERKKCKVTQYLLEKHHSKSIDQLQREIDKKEDKVYELHDRYLSEKTIQEQWQDKIAQIIKMFVKFISFAMDLLPEHALFLIDVEKMFMLQVNEIYNKPNSSETILVTEDNVNNSIFFFDRLTTCNDSTEPYACVVDIKQSTPFIVYGDMEVPPKVVYGSRETIPDDASLPAMIVGDKYLYVADGEQVNLDNYFHCKCGYRQKIKCHCSVESLDPLCDCINKENDKCYCDYHDDAFQISSSSLSEPELCYCNVKCHCKSSETSTSKVEKVRECLCELPQTSSSSKDHLKENLCQCDQESKPDSDICNCPPSQSSSSNFCFCITPQKTCKCSRLWREKFCEARCRHCNKRKLHTENSASDCKLLTPECMNWFEKVSMHNLVPFVEFSKDNYRKLLKYEDQEIPNTEEMEIPDEFQDVDPFKLVIDDVVPHKIDIGIQCDLEDIEICVCPCMKETRTYDDDKTNDLLENCNEAIRKIWRLNPKLLALFVKGYESVPEIRRNWW